MAVVIRLRREGRKNRAFYRIAVCDSRKKRDGRFIELIGFFDPLTKDKNINIDMEKFRDWVAKGAKPSPRVQSIVRKHRKTVNESVGLK